MTRYVRVPIEAEERECGKRCQGLNYGAFRRYCGMFPTKKYEVGTCVVGKELRRLVMIDGAPQRCPQCLAAEVKTEVPNGRAV